MTVALYKLATQESREEHSGLDVYTIDEKPFIFLVADEEDVDDLVDLGWSLTTAEAGAEDDEVEEDLEVVADTDESDVDEEKAEDLFDTQEESEEEITEESEEKAEDELRAEYVEILTKAGVSFHPNTGLAKLKAKVDELDQKTAS